MSDLKKIASSINRDRKLCNDLADRYIDEIRKDDPEFYEKCKSSWEYDSKTIRSGPAHIEVFAVGEFVVCDLEQDPLAWVCGDYLFDAFCKAINAKYYREIQLGIMSKMNDLGDGDEGLIGCSYY